MSSVFHIQEHVISVQHIREYPGATANRQEDELKMHVKQYNPVDQGPIPNHAVTVIGAHANGFPKELFEPLWEGLYRTSKACGFSIRAIWVADVVSQGTSGVLNENQITSWMDHSRDLLHMINHFRDQMPRPLVGIGHSMGGCQLVNLSIIHPRLLTTLILFDPIIHILSFDPSKIQDFIGYASTFRRDVWPSRQAAAESFRKSPFYRNWDKRVFDLWLEYGLRDLPTALYPGTPEPKMGESPVTLTTTKHQEVWTFIRPNFDGLDSQQKPVLHRRTHADLDLKAMNYPFYRPEPSTTFHSLPILRPSVLYIYGDESNVSSPELRQEKLELTGIGVGGSGGAAEGRVKEELLTGVGHLVPMEAVDDSAQLIARWLGQELRLWRRNEDEWRRLRSQRPARDHIAINEDWLKHIGPPPSRRKPIPAAKL